MVSLFEAEQQEYRKACEYFDVETMYQFYLENRYSK